MSKRGNKKTNHVDYNQADHVERIDPKPDLGEYDPETSEFIINNPDHPKWQNEKNFIYAGGTIFWLPPELYGEGVSVEDGAMKQLLMLRLMRENNISNMVLSADDATLVVERFQKDDENRVRYTMTGPLQGQDEMLEKQDDGIGILFERHKDFYHDFVRQIHERGEFSIPTEDMEFTLIACRDFGFRKDIEDWPEYTDDYRAEARGDEYEYVPVIYSEDVKKDADEAKSKEEIDSVESHESNERTSDSDDGEPADTSDKPKEPEEEIPRKKKPLSEEMDVDEIIRNLNNKLFRGDDTPDKTTFKVSGRDVEIIDATKRVINWNKDDGMPDIVVMIDGRKVGRETFEQFIADHKSEFVQNFNNQYLKDLEELGKTRKKYERGDVDPVDEKDREAKEPVIDWQKEGDFEEGRAILNEAMEKYGGGSWKNVAFKAGPEYLEISKQKVRNPDGSVEKKPRYSYIVGNASNGKTDKQSYGLMCKYVSVYEQEFRAGLEKAIEKDKGKKKSEPER